MNFAIASVVQQIINEIQEAQEIGLPIGMPTHVEFSTLVYDKDDISVNIEFDVPLLRISSVGGALIDFSYGYKKKN